MSKEITKENLEHIQNTLNDYSVKLETRVKDLLAEGKSNTDAEVVKIHEAIAKIGEDVKAVQQKIAFAGQVSIPGAERELKLFSLGKFCKALYEMADKSINSANPWKGAELEKELVDEYAKTRTNYAADGTAGGYLIPTEVADEVIGITYANIPMLSQLPVRRVEGLRGDFRIPKLTSGTTAYWVGELAAPTASSAVYGEIVGREKRVAAFTKQSKRLMYQSSGVSDQIIKDDLGKAMAVQLHNGLLNGSGNEYQPKGLLKYTGDMTASEAIGTNGGRFTITHAELMQMTLDKLNEFNENPANYGYLMRPEAKFGLKTERVEQYSAQPKAKGAPVLPVYAILPDAVLKEIVGNFATTTQLSAALTKGSSPTCSNVLYGNWQYFWLLMWEGMEIRVSDQAYDGSVSAFSQNQVFIIAEQGVDCVVTRPSAFTYLADAETNSANW